jgi:1-phosphofructokinase family hexose kinase
VILAAGLSPAWQQIVVLDRLQLGDVNRAREVHWCASGKVLNVGLALNCLSISPTLRQGEPGGVAGELGVRNSECGVNETTQNQVRTLAVVGGLTGEAIRREFAEAGIHATWIKTESATRVCTTILDAGTGQTTELVENAVPITTDELWQFQQAYIDAARHADVVVLAGSFPGGVPATFYRDLLAETPGRVVLDAQREPLLAALERRPFVVKPNREELGNTLGRRLETDDQLRAAMREFCRRGATWVVVSEGKERVWIGSERTILSVRPLPVDVINPIGCGDCLAAGVAVALARGEDLPDAVLYGMAAAAENARHLLPARLDPRRVAELRTQIERQRCRETRNRRLGTI